MKLRRDKKNPHRFWFGKSIFQWVDLAYPIRKIKNDLIFTIGGIFKVTPDKAPYYLTVTQIS